MVIHWGLYRPVDSHGARASLQPAAGSFTVRRVLQTFPGQHGGADGRTRALNKLASFRAAPSPTVVSETKTAATNNNCASRNWRWTLDNLTFLESAPGNFSLHLDILHNRTTFPEAQERETKKWPETRLQDTRHRCCKLGEMLQPDPRPTKCHSTPLTIPSKLQLAIQL